MTSAVLLSRRSWSSRHLSLSCRRQRRRRPSSWSSPFPARSTCCPRARRPARAPTALPWFVRIFSDHTGERDDAILTVTFTASADSALSLAILVAIRLLSSSRGTSFMRRRRLRECRRDTGRCPTFHRGDNVEFHFFEDLHRSREQGSRQSTWSAGPTKKRPGRSGPLQPTLLTLASNGDGEEPPRSPLRPCCVRAPARRLPLRLLPHHGPPRRLPG